LSYDSLVRRRDELITKGYFAASTEEQRFLLLVELCTFCKAQQNVDFGKQSKN
jgi:hypothetical protein